MKSLNVLRPLRLRITGLRRKWLRLRHGIHLADTVSLSLKARFVSGAPGSIRVGTDTLVAFKTLVVSRTAEGSVRPVTIGDNCFVGAGSVILPGVTIGNNSIVGASAVVFEDVPARSIVAGNPARVVASDVDILPFGRLPEADDNTQKYWFDQAGR
ncbi:DapH/DapD/GlmU-related protein [Qipengyuania nanhaisediminis]|uniref:DapH/DapD/GlmU-related protein n=1 Tax=Qipengyuania nanhaisediminis TaxID=604088 RepID=UPI0038B2F5B8